MIKKIFVFFSILLVFNNLCFAESVIKGTIKNLPKDVSFGVSYKLPITYEYYYDDKIELTDDQFELRIDNIDPIKLEVWFNDYHLDFYVLPNDTITFSCDAQNPKNTLSIESSHLEDQKYSTALSLIESNQYVAMRPYKIKNVGWGGYPSGFTDSLRKVEVQLKNEFYKNEASKFNTTSTFKLDYADTSYQPILSILYSMMFQNMRQIGDMKIKSQAKEITIDSFNNALSKIQIENLVYKYNYTYLEFLNRYLEYKLNLYKKQQNDNKLSQSEWFTQKLNYIDKLFKNDSIKYIVSLYSIGYNLDRSPDLFIELTNKNLEKYPNARHKDVLIKQMAQKASIQNGKVAPAFTLKDISGKSVSLSDFKGKVVYIDFWASWCLPCIAENKSVKKLKPIYKDKNVVFLYISRDGNDSVWHDAIKKQEIEGIHLIKGNSNVFDQYQAQGVPKYVLIGKNGNIIASDAPRPSNKEALMDLIDNALKEE